MSLFSSLHIAGNSLRATQIGLQVVGQNVANANTPGYIREDVVFSPAPTQRIGSLQMGLGVTVDGIVQQVDLLLEQRLRNATSDRASAETQEQTFQQLESLTSELGDHGLGKSLADFMGSINDVLNQPESTSVRNLTVLRGQTLASDINRANQRVDALRNDVSEQLDAGTADVNRLVREIAELNVRIAKSEGGNRLRSAAVGLRDERQLALGELAQWLDINVQEQKNGTVSVYVGGDFLVFGDEAREIQLLRTNRGDELRVIDNNALLDVQSGKLQGLIRSRDAIIGGYQGHLDNFARALAFEFNRIHSSGQGLSGYSALTSVDGVTDANAALDAAGLPYTPVNGSFQLQLYNRRTGLTKTTNITVDLNGLEHDTTLTDLAGALDAVDGVTASINANGRLTISSDSNDQELAFGNDTSGVLAALGINTFFTGTSAATLGINQALLGDPSKVAASQGGVGVDAENAVDMAGFLDRPLDSQNGSSISELQEIMNADLTQSSAETQSVAQGHRVFEASLKGQSLSISGVNIDEEAIKMLTFQRNFQASAKFLSTINDLLGVLIDL